MSTLTTRQEIVEIINATLYKREEDQSLSERIKKIAHQVFQEEQNRSEMWQFLKNERYKEDIKKIAEVYFRDRKEQLVTDSKLASEQTARQTSQTYCQIEIPKILKHETTEYLKFLIQSDDRLGNAYDTYQQELKSVEDEFLAKIKTSARSDLIEFQNNVSLESKRVLDDIVSRKCDEFFFTSMIEKLSQENSQHVEKNILLVQTAYQKCVEVSVEHQQSMIQLKLDEQRKDGKRAKELENLKAEIWWNRIWCIGLSVAALLSFYPRLR